MTKGTTAKKKERGGERRKRGEPNQYLLYGKGKESEQGTACVTQSNVLFPYLFETLPVDNLFIFC